MKKISNKSNNILFLFIFKSVILSLLCVTVLSYILSHIFLNLDIDLEKAGVFSVFISAISACVAPSLSVLSLKNNGAIMGVLSNVPLIIYSLINAVLNNSSLLYFIIKIALYVTFGAFFGYITVNRKKKIKVR